MRRVLIRFSYSFGCVFIDINKQHHTFLYLFSYFDTFKSFQNHTTRKLVVINDIRTHAEDNHKSNHKFSSEILDDFTM